MGEMMNDGGAMYNFAEIWPVFQMNANAGSYNMAGDSGMDLMASDPRTNHDPDHESRKRRGEDIEAGNGDSTINSNGNPRNNPLNEGDHKRIKADENGENEDDGERNPGKAVEQPVKPAEPPKQDYIHVRARRGQATDSHSLAERARREKISERMKILQELVPGCNKVVGKALVLDEIINYIQSLQRQVEFLSMKLEAVNTRMTPGIDGFPSKDFAQQSFDMTGLPFVSQPTREYSRGASPEWLHMQIGSGFERTS